MAKPPGTQDEDPGNGDKKGSGKTVAKAMVSAMEARDRRKRRKRFLTKWGISMLVLILFGGGGVGFFTYQLVGKVSFDLQDKRPAIGVYAANGGLIANFSDIVSQKFDYVSLKPDILNAFIAALDPDFHTHFGITGADIARLTDATRPPGTITLRLAQKAFVHQKQSLIRTIEELLVAAWIEIRFDKHDILSKYLARAYAGQGVFGVDAAARQFFSTSAAGLTLKTAAAIAGAIENPAQYNPLTAPKAADKRSGEIIQTMADLGMIKQDKVRRYLNAPLALRPARRNTSARHLLAKAALDELARYIGFPNRHITVKTTLDLKMQAAAENHIHKFLGRYGDKRGISNAALVVMKPTGEVLALAGGGGGPSLRNRAGEQRRRTGALFSLYPYLVALENGMQPEEWVRDNPLVVEGWQPRNASGKHYGQITMKDAFALGLETVPARFLQEYGADQIIATARKMGVRSRLRARAQMAAGTDLLTLQEVTQSYAVVASGGFNVVRGVVTEVTDRSGEVLYRRPPPPKAKLLAPERAGHAHQLLTTAMTGGIARGARLDRQAAGMAATTRGYRDAWFVGYSADLVAGVWLGNDSGKKMSKVTGHREGAGFWRNFMLNAHSNIPVRTISRGMENHAKQIAEAAEQG